MDQKQLLRIIKQAARERRTGLDLRGENLTSLPGEIGQLRYLIRLDLGRNKLTSLPAEIGQLENLRELYLHDNNLTSLPAEISQLEHLTVLWLQRNNLTSLPAEIGQLKNLTALGLSANKLSTLPREIAQLENLTALDLSGNNLTSLPAEICQLKGLGRLYLHANMLTCVPGQIGQLKNLRELYLASNSLTSVPGEIAQLKNLIGLTLNRNNLTSLPGEIGRLKNLKQLSLSHNNLTSLPAEIGRLKNLRGLNLRGNPLEEPPPEILKQGTRAILNYLESIEGEDVSRLYEAKLLIVGPGDVGKTYLMNRLITGETPATVSTEGIEINQWRIDTAKVKDMRVNFWDFGGQEIYHATHQFFLTKRSLYLFVWEARKDDDLTSFDYWLNVLKLLSDSAPVIVVMNKVDERTKAIDERSLKDKFENIVSFHKVSATEGIGTAELERQIRNEIGELPHIGDRLPKVWLDIREELESLDNNFISFEEYKAICGRFGLGEAKADFLSSYFHELGVFLHFDDNPVLRDIVFLRPEWATNAVYKILDTREIQDNYGRFEYDQLRAIWGDYPQDKYAVLLELMNKFELCFRLGDTRWYIVPELLRAERPKSAYHWNDEDNIRYEYRYDFMPAGILTRFIVRTHDIIKDDIYWKNGVALRREEAEALIVSDTYGRKISIRVRGEDKKGLLAIIRREIDYIHNTLNNPDVDEMVPCNCSTCKDAEEPYYFKLERIKTRLRTGKRTLDCGKSGEDVDIHKILGDVIVAEEGLSPEESFMISGNRTEKGYPVEIRKINISGGHVSIAGRVDTIVYNENLGVSKGEFDELRAAIKNLSGDKQAQLSQMSGELTGAGSEEKQPIIERIQTFLIENGIPVAQSLTAAAIFELARVFAG
ncbi:MAG: COR domain-containing protein [Planctomycetota bacterium]|jgi:small GTP-binding protein